MSVIHPDRFFERATKDGWHPRSALESRIYNKFEEFKGQKQAALLFVNDAYDRRYYFICAETAEKAHQKMESINGPNTGCSVLVAMDLNRPFEDQWPAEKTPIGVPLQLMQDPINTLPALHVQTGSFAEPKPAPR